MAFRFFQLPFFGWVALTGGVIDCQQQLDKLLPRLQDASWIALDTEADSLHAYPEKLCLLQISYPGAEVLIDTLAPLDLAALFPILSAHEIILHGGDYDLRLMRRIWNFVPRAVFDTMLAARILGLREFGLTNLATRYLNISLEKGPQKANWSRRPLTDRMLTYARNDTRHLKPLAELLRQDLAQKGRLAWHTESCANLVADCAQLRPRNPELEWRIKGSERLPRKALGVLRELWRWREREARRTNKPPFFVMCHESLTKLAKQSLAQPLATLFPDHWSPRRRVAIRSAIKRGLSLPPEAQPDLVHPVHQRINEAARRHLEELRQRRDHWASELGIDPTLIASRTTLIRLAQDWDTQQGSIMKWQLELLRNSG